MKFLNKNSICRFFFRIFFVRHYRFLDVYAILMLSLLGELIVAEVDIHAPYKLVNIDWGLFFKVFFLSIVSLRLFYFMANINEIKHNTEKKIEIEKEKARKEFKDFNKSIDEIIVNEIEKHYIVPIFIDISIIIFSSIALLFIIIYN
ncbi:MAG: hypothetical protein NTZ33_15550 [Bacteroidetes bacterium]|nr:hypothetical protein [Bacteroidota bacterium]